MRVDLPYVTMPRPGGVCSLTGSPFPRFATAVLTRAAPTQTARNEHAAPLARLATDFAVHCFLQQRLTNENALDFSRPGTCCAWVPQGSNLFSRHPGLFAGLSISPNEAHMVCGSSSRLQGEVGSCAYSSDTSLLADFRGRLALGRRGILSTAVASRPASPLGNECLCLI